MDFYRKINQETVMALLRFEIPEKLIDKLPPLDDRLYLKSVERMLKNYGKVLNGKNIEVKKLGLQLKAKQKKLEFFRNRQEIINLLKHKKRIPIHLITQIENTFGNKQLCLLIRNESEEIFRFLCTNKKPPFINKFLKQLIAKNELVQLKKPKSNRKLKTISKKQQFIKVIYTPMGNKR